MAALQLPRRARPQPRILRRFHISPRPALRPRHMSPPRGTHPLHASRRRAMRLRKRPHRATRPRKLPRRGTRSKRLAQRRGRLRVPQPARAALSRRALRRVAATMLGHGKTHSKTRRRNQTRLRDRP
jgi:hypothetical protein